MLKNDTSDTWSLLRSWTVNDMNRNVVQTQSVILNIWTKSISSYNMAKKNLSHPPFLSKTEEASYQQKITIW